VGWASYLPHPLLWRLVFLNFQDGCVIMALKVVLKVSFLWLLSLSIGHFNQILQPLTSS
jgi:hypothetical protein